MTISRSIRNPAVLLCVFAVLAAPLGADETKPATNSPDKPKAGKPAPPATAAKAEPPKRQPPVKQAVQLKPEAAEKQAAPRVAHIRLEGIVLSSPPDFSWFGDQAPGMTLREWVQRLAKARNDENVRAVALEVDMALMNWAQAQELADAVGRLNAVKPVYAHVTSGGALSYLVASAARETTMEPAGTLMLVGLGAELMFFKGTLNWLGIDAQMIQIGRYKGAAEPYTRTGPTPEMKGEYDKLLDDLYDQLCQQIARQRRLTVPHVRNAIDEGPLDAPQAKDFRLVDRLVPKSEWREYVAGKVAHDQRAKSAVLLPDYARKKRKEMDLSNPFAVFSLMMGGRGEEKTQDPTVAIVHADGMIVPGKSGQGIFGTRMVGSATMTECFEQVARDDNVKAVIFRIDSPGGSALASELILQAARKCAAKKPVIVSIAGLGASGGYYIALGGQKVLADPAALVGSIGVVAGKLALSGLYDKIGISTCEITRGRNAGLFLSRRWGEREEAKVRAMAARTYDTFVSRVKESRGKRIKDVGAVAQGRIFTARQAAKNGLIDEIGGLREAVAAAQSAAKLKSSHFLLLPRPQTLLDMLYGGGVSAPPAPAAATDLLERFRMMSPGLLSAPSQEMAGAAYLLELGRMLSAEHVLAAMPCHVSVRP